MLPQLAVNYPASSPFVTGVGGTNFLLNANNTIQAEIVWNDTTVQLGAGGGGLSDLFGRPSYQVGVVGVNQRAVPDISMLADSYPGYAIYCTAGPPDCGQQGPWTTVGGTSAAAPLFAGGAALVDEYLNHEGHEELGFVNPLLYVIGKDSRASPRRCTTTSPRSATTSGRSSPATASRSAAAPPAAGFDDASGWGSIDLPNFALVAKAALPKFGDVSVQFVKPQRPVSSPRAQGRRALHAAVPRDRRGRGRGRQQGDRVARIEGRADRAQGHQGRGPEVLARAFEGKLRKALAHHKRISIRMLGAAVDSRGNIAKVTAVRSLTVKS